MAQLEEDWKSQQSGLVWCFRRLCVRAMANGGGEVGRAETPSGDSSAGALFSDHRLPLQEMEARGDGHHGSQADLILPLSLRSLEQVTPVRLRWGPHREVSRMPSK